MQSLMPPIDSSDSLFHNGNPLTGEKGTIVTADWLNNVQSAIRAEQSELISILTAAGLTPDAVKANQLLEALNLLYAAKNTINGKQDKNDNLTSLSGLAGSADRLAYFTAAKTLALTALTSVGRDIVGKSTVADVLTYLGLGSAATKSVGAGAGQIPDMSTFNSLKSLSGYQFLPGGLVIQWGQVATPSAGQYTASLPVAFPTAHLRTLVCVYDDTNSSTATAKIQTSSATLTQIKMYVLNAISATSVNYLSIGY